MTKKLEELFNLDSDTVKTQEAVKPVPEEVFEKTGSLESINSSYQEAKKMSSDLPKIRELEKLGETELDVLADKAEQAYDDLMDLGMNVEVRYAGRIFEVASTMLKNAIDAKATKIEKKLKAVELQMRKYKIDKDYMPADGDQTLEGYGYIISDRNDLLKQLQQDSKPKD